MGLLSAWAVDGQGRKQSQVWWSHYEQGPFLPQHLGFSVIHFVFPKSRIIRLHVDSTKGKALGSRWPKWEVDRQKKFLEAKPKRAQVALTCRGHGEGLTVFRIVRQFVFSFTPIFFLYSSVLLG